MHLSERCGLSGGQGASAAFPCRARSTCSVSCARWRSKCSRVAACSRVVYRSPCGRWGLWCFGCGEGGLHGLSSLALNVLGGLLPMVQQVLNGGGVRSCSASLAEGKVMLVQGGRPQRRGQPWRLLLVVARA